MKNDCLPAPPEPFDPRPGRFPRAGGLERPQTPRRPRAFLRPHRDSSSVKYICNIYKYIFNHLLYFQA